MHFFLVPSRIICRHTLLFCFIGQSLQLLAEGTPSSEDLDVVFSIAVEEKAVKTHLDLDDFLNVYYLIEQNHAMDLGAPQGALRMARSASDQLKSKFAERLVGEEVLDVELSESEVKLLREKFRTLTASKDAKEAPLDAATFERVIREPAETLGSRKPTSDDVLAAFALAEVDQKGTVDEIEFIHLYKLVKNGTVKGLGGQRGLLSSPSKHRKKQKHFQRSFSVRNDILSPDDLKKASKKVRKMKGSRSGELDRDAFRKFMKETMKETIDGELAMPPARDLNAVK